MEKRMYRMLKSLLVFALAVFGLLFVAGDAKAETEKVSVPSWTLGHSEMPDTMEGSATVTMSKPKFKGAKVIVKSKDNKPYTIKLKGKVTNLPENTTAVEFLIGEKEPDGKIYTRTYVYTTDASNAENGKLKITEELQSSDWTPVPGSVLKVGVIAYALSDDYDPNGYSKGVSTGYDELYDVPVGEDVEGKHKLTVNHVNQNNRMIAYQEVSYLAEGEKYNVPSLDINGYTAKKEAITGTMGSKDITLNSEYEGEATTISIAYKSWVDGSDQDIADAYTANVKVGDSYSVDSPDVEGYQLSSGDYYKTVKGVVPVGGVSETVYYTKTKYWLSVRHLDENGNELYSQADQYQFAPGEEYYYDDSDGFYSAPIRSFDGYTLVSGDYTEKDVEDEEGNVTKVKVIEGTMPEKNKDVTLNYVHNQTYVNCKFSFVGLDDTVTAPEGIPADFTDHVDSWSSYTYEPPVIDGWQIVNNGSYSNYYDAKKIC